MNRATLSLLTAAVLTFALTGCRSTNESVAARPYPAEWWKEAPRQGALGWEILPQEAKPGTVVLSKRNELGLLSNFAPTPFVFHGKRYASLEGFWQMMKYPEDAKDARATFPGLEWKYTREEVALNSARAAEQAALDSEKAAEKFEQSAANKLKPCPKSRDAKGRFAKDSEKPASSGKYTSSDRRRDWKAEADKPTRPDYTPEDMERMKKGLPPQRYNPDKEGIESMERAHEPVPLRDGGTKTAPKWPQEHAESDPNRHPGY